MAHSTRSSEVNLIAVILQKIPQSFQKCHTYSWTGSLTKSPFKFLLFFNFNKPPISYLLRSPTPCALVLTQIFLLRCGCSEVSITGSHVNKSPTDYLGICLIDPPTQTPSPRNHLESIWGDKKLKFLPWDNTRDRETHKEKAEESRTWRMAIQSIDGQIAILLFPVTQWTGAPYLLSIISRRSRNATVVLGGQFYPLDPLGSPLIGLYD